MQMLTASGNGATAQQPPHLWIHGANLEFTPAEFQQKFQRLLDANRAHVTFVGRYDHKQLPQLMADIDWVVVPSIWWENSPLVIQEAFAHGRPVICSNIGGMAEKVDNGVNGLHFRVNDPVNLADVLRTAATSANLWDTLRAGICPIHSMDEHVINVERFYGALLGD
jgi:glycosyltransferase involved in cell wall biosynthesis